MSDDNKFVDGLWIDKKEGTPDFVVCRLSFFEPKFAEYMVKNINEKGYVNVDVLRSREGKIYAKLNDWKPTQQVEQEEQNTPGDIPF